MASLVLLCLAHTAAAIDPNRDLSQYIHDEWGTAKGFPGGQVYAITQTSDGYLWIGAEKGLVRFDGLNFHLFQHANTPVIPVGPIRSLVADNEGSLWIHFGGPLILRYANGKFEAVASLLPQGEPAVTAMGRGANGEVLISALVNGTNINRSCCGRGINLKTIFVTIPRVPSLPIIKCVTLYPVEYFNVFAPVQITSPFANTTCKFNT